MQKFALLSKHLYIFYTFVFLIHIINVFVQNPLIANLVGFLALIMFIVSFFGATKLFQTLSGLFVLAGSIFFIVSDAGVSDIPAFLTTNLSLLALMSVMPWMNSVVKSGRFDRSLNRILKEKVSDLGNLYPKNLVTTMILAAFLNLSCAPISLDVLKKSLSGIKKNVRDSFITSSFVRGYTLAIFWSPLEILVLTSVFIVGAEYIKVLPWLVIITALTFTADSFWGKMFYKKHLFNGNEPHNGSQNSDEMKIIKAKILQLLVALVFFLITVTAAVKLFKLEFILAVTLLIIPFTFAWAWLMKRAWSFKVIGWNSWKESTNRMQNFIILFISLSFFSSSLNGSGFLNLLEKPIADVLDYPLVLFLAVQSLFIILSLFGVHPLATLGIVSGLIAPLAQVLNPVSLALVLISGSVATTSVGTYGLLVTITSISLDLAPFKITMRNLSFAMLMNFISSLIAMLLL